MSTWKGWKEEKSGEDPHAGWGIDNIWVRTEEPDPEPGQSAVDPYAWTKEEVFSDSVEVHYQPHVLHGNMDVQTGSSPRPPISQGAWGQYNQEQQGWPRQNEDPYQGWQGSPGTSSGWSASQQPGSSWDNYTSQLEFADQKHHPSLFGPAPAPPLPQPPPQPVMTAREAGRLYAISHPSTLAQITELRQNPLLLPVNTKELLQSKNEMFRQLDKRFANVREIDPAAAARLAARQRMDRDRQPYISRARIAHKRAGPPRNFHTLPPRAPSPQEDSAPSVQDEVQQQQRRTLEKKSQPRRFHREETREIEFIPLGRAETAGKKTLDDIWPEESAVPVGTQQTLPFEEVAKSSSESSDQSEAEVELADEMEVDDNHVSMDDLARGFKKLDIPRECFFPKPDSGMIEASSWRAPEGEVGRLSQTCMCSAVTESVKSPAIRQWLSMEDLQMAESLCRVGYCTGTYRNENLLLNECGISLDADTVSKMLVQWTPQRGAFAFFCQRHVSLLRQHKICPYCNEFYQPGRKDFVVCRKRADQVHLYHLDCQVRMSLSQQCPHCLADTSSTIKEFYTGRDCTLSSAKSSSLQIDGLYRENDVYNELKIPDGSGAFFSYCGHVTAAEVDELSALSKKPVRMSRDEVTAALPDLALTVLLTCKAQYPDLLKRRQTNGDSLMHIAARSGKVSALLVLEKCGLSHDAVNAAGETPFIVAVKERRGNVVVCLIECCAAVNKQDNEGRTALHWAAIKQFLPAMTVILQHTDIDASIPDKAGFAAVFYTLTWMKQMEFYSLAMMCIGLRVLDRDGWSLMHWAAFFHRTDLVQYFLDLQLSNVGDVRGDTPMHVAVRVGNVRFVSQLLECRPPLPVTVKNKEGYSPYRLARYLSVQAKSEELRQAAETIVRKMERLMPQLITKEELQGRILSAVRGQVCGDISRGRSVIPIPCYNFINDEAYSHELIYSNNVVRPIIFQNEPLLQKHFVFSEPCTSSSDSKDCVASRCDCAKVKLCPQKGSRSLCGKCKSTGGFHFLSSVINDCYVETVAAGSGSIKLPSNRQKKPKPTDVIRQRRRLHKQAARRPDLAGDLLYIDHLLDSQFRPRKRCQSWSRSSPRPLLTVGEEAIGRQDVTADDYTTMEDLDALVRSIARGSHVDATIDMQDADGASSVEGSTATQSSEDSQRNVMDLFDEIERFNVSFLTKAAVIRFERRHPFERWDLSAKYPGVAVQRHPPDTSLHPSQPSLSTVSPRSEEEKMVLSDENFLYGCSIRCPCAPNCAMRIWQQPSRVHMALVFVNDIVKWGVIALAHIPRGHYLCEYTGELVDGNLYGCDSYMYEVNIPGLAQPKGKESTLPFWVVDAKKVGNIGRFFNHSCVPNAKTLELHEHGMVVPRLCTIALRTIYPGEAITLDYGSEWWSAKQNSEGFACLCGEEACLYKNVPNRPFNHDHLDDQVQHLQEEDEEYNE